MNEKRVLNILDEQTPVAAAQQQGLQPAGIAERFVALLIDFGVIFIPCQFLLIVAARLLDLDLNTIYLLLLGINIIFILYEAIFTAGGRATLGKNLVGIQVVKKDTYENLGFISAFIRAVGYYISAALFMCGFLMAFFDDKHRALQDFLAGSVVVRVRPKGAVESMLLTASGVILMIVFLGFFYNQIFSKGSFVQRRMIRNAEIHLEKISLLEEIHFIMYGRYTNDLLRLSLLSGDPVQFQRDTQAVFQPKGFALGVTQNGYKMTAVAKDSRNTRVFFTAQGDE